MERQNIYANQNDGISHLIRKRLSFDASIFIKDINFDKNIVIFLNVKYNKSVVKYSKEIEFDKLFKRDRS